MRSLFAETLPLWPVDEEGRCTCGQACTRAGKHPAKNAPEGGGYVVVTGAASGVFVVDVDIKGGTDGYAQLEAFPALPETLAVRTGSGGAHFYFRHPGFTVRNRKLASAIDIKGDAQATDGLVYVVGPGSPGYKKTSDPCVVTPADPYEVVEPADIADAPEWLLSWLRIGETRTEGFAPTPIDERHVDWSYRLTLAEGACKTFPPSAADGEGGKRLFAICMRLVRGYELPVETAYELIVEHFNPRCTDPLGNPYPWDDADILHKLEDARDRSNTPTGIPSQATTEGIKALAARMGNPNRMPVVAPTKGKTKDKVGAGRAYDGERVKVTKAGLAAMLYGTGAEDWENVLWWDVLAQKPRATNPPLAGRMTLEDGEFSEGDIAEIALWFDCKGFLVSSEAIKGAIWNVVRSPDRQRNLITEYLDNLPEVTAAAVLPTLATDVFGCADATANTVLLKTLVAAVRRARNPGHFHKGMLVLKGAQRCGKTPAVKILAGDWYHTTGNGNLADRDTILECQGKWLVEVEELSALNKADADALKTAISRTSDVITKKYAPDGRRYDRSFVLIGTTNKDEFLSDTSGNARYQIIEVGKIDLAKLAELRDVIWAEADFLARTTDATSNELTEEENATVEEQNKSYLDTHPWLDEVARYLARTKEVASSSEVLMHILKGDATKATLQSKRAVADIMRTLGCETKVCRRGGKSVRVWTVPGDLPARAPSVTPLRMLKGGSPP